MSILGLAFLGEHFFSHYYPKTSFSFSHSHLFLGLKADFFFSYFFLSLSLFFFFFFFVGGLFSPRRRAIATTTNTTSTSSSSSGGGGSSSRGISPHIPSRARRISCSSENTRRILRWTGTGTCSVGFHTSRPGRVRYILTFCQ